MACQSEKELCPICWLSSAFYCNFFFISVPAASLCYCSYSVVCPSLHILLLFKKFSQLLIYLNSFPPTLVSCPWRIGISWKMGSVFLYHGYRIQWKQEKHQIFSAFRATHKSQTCQTKRWGENFPGVLSTNQGLYQSWEGRSKVLRLQKRYQMNFNQTNE